MAFEIKQNDTRPRFRVPLKQDFGEETEAAIDLTDATSVVFHMRAVSGGAVKVEDGACTIEGDPTLGIVQYEWQAGDTDTAGEFEAEVEILWDDGGVETVPNNEYWAVTVFDDVA